MLLAVGLLLAMAGPAAAARDAPSGNQEIRALLLQAEQAAREGNAEQAATLFRRAIAEFPSGPFRDNAFLGLGRAEYLRRDYASAALAYRTLIDNFPTSTLMREARRLLAEDELRLGNADAALPLLEAERGLATDGAIKRALTDRIIEIFDAKQDQLKIIDNLLTKRDLVPEGERQAETDRIVERIGQCTPEQLAQVIARHPGRFPGDFALIRLSETDEAHGDVYEAEGDLKRFLAVFPSHGYAARARERLDDLRKRALTSQHRIGVLLPLSGPLRRFGREILNGVRLAAEGAETTAVGLAVRDSESASGSVVPAWDELIRDYRPAAVIGPLLSRQVIELAPRAERQRTPLIAPAASAASMAPGSRFVVRYGLTNLRQGVAIAEYGAGRLQLKRFVILYPNNGVGRELARVFADQVRARGAEVIAIESYPPGATDFSVQIKRLKSADLAKYGVLGPPPVKRGQIQDYTPGFDAVFLPGDYDEVGLIAAQLAFYDIQNVVLLGANGWDSTGLFEIGGRYVDGGVFVDGFFSGSASPEVRAFSEAYRARYQAEPTLLAAQAYDATRLVLEALRTGAATGEAVRDQILARREFRGATGRTVFTSDGEVERSLFLIRVKNGRFEEVQ